MALSGLFLVLFLTQHFVINVMSVLAPEIFNDWSHFMGYNGLVQYILQPILIGGVVLHFVVGFVLQYQNHKARPISYVKYNGNANSTWVSRNMLITGAVVLAFIGLHMYDFWWHEMSYKYIDGTAPAPDRYHEETVAKFADIWRVVLYVIAFILLAMHLFHGFKSSFQSMGVANKYQRSIRRITEIWAIAIPAGFIFIAIYHHFNQLS